MATKNSCARKWKFITVIDLSCLVDLVGLIGLVNLVSWIDLTTLIELAELDGLTGLIDLVDIRNLIRRIARVELTRAAYAPRLERAHRFPGGDCDRCRPGWVAGFGVLVFTTASFCFWPFAGAAGSFLFADKFTILEIGVISQIQIPWFPRV